MAVYKIVKQPICTIIKNVNSIRIFWTGIFLLEVKNCLLHMLGIKFSPILYDKTSFRTFLCACWLSWMRSSSMLCFGNIIFSLVPLNLRLFILLLVRWVLVMFIGFKLVWRWFVALYFVSDDIIVSMLLINVDCCVTCKSC